MAIKPISVPTGAGISYGEGDVRHFSEGDAQDVPGLQNPTRYLAQRDNLLASKLNEVIEMVNNREQIIMLPVLRTQLAPSEQFTPVNYRIPEGFEARILNASVASDPLSSDIQLDIYYSDSFGAEISGDALVTTTDEFDAGTSFQNPGELIVRLTNNGDTSLEAIASITLTMRPIGSSGSLLVGSVIKGDKGDPGQQGAPGPQGIPGTGGAGSPGMIWRSTWMSGISYSPPDVVSFPLYGTVVSSYIALVGHLSDTSNQPPNTSFWDPVAVGSSGSVVGVQGPAGADGGGAVTTAFQSVTITLTTGADWSSGTYTGYAGPGIGPSASYPTTVQEARVNSTTGTIALLTGRLPVAFLGSGTITLPTTAGGASADYDNGNVNVVAALNGSQAAASTIAFSGTGVTVVPVSSNQFVVKVVASTPQRVGVALYGMQLI